MRSKMKHAVSLIVLVVTILVLSILAAAVIISLSNASIIEQASNTTFKQDMANYKETYELYVTSKLADNANFDRSGLNVTYASKPQEFNEIFGDKVPDRYKNGLRIIAGKLVYITEDETENAILKELRMVIEDTISKEPSSVEPTLSPYIGYYADVDGDGTVDGVIFADLLEGWLDESYSNYWYDEGSGTFDMSSQKVTKSEAKDYYVSQETYSVEGASGYGEKPVLTAIGKGKDRFYVMSLNDFTSGVYSTFYWYGNKDTVETFTAFGKGKENTFNMLSDSSTTERDMWKLIQQAVYGTNYSKETKTVNDIKWFVPSRDEWEAFGYAFDLTDSNYTDFGLSYYYWSSSIRPSAISGRDPDSAYCAKFFDTYSLRWPYGIATCYFDLSNSVRLATTF